MKNFLNNLTDTQKLLLATIAVGVLLVLVMSAISGGITYIGNKRLQRTSGNFNAAINAQTEQSGQVNANIAELEKKDAAANQAVQIRREELRDAQTEVKNAETNTNIAINAADSIRNGNYAGTGRAAANKARCRAYPNSKGC